MPLQRGANAKTSTPAAASPKDGAAAPAPPSQDFILAGVIGSQLSEPLAAIGQVIDDFVRTRGITAGQITQLRASLALARTVAKQSQQVARLASGRLRQSHERLKLDEMLGNALHERRDSLKQLGVDLHQTLKPVEVIVDPGLLSSLLDASLDWAVSMGQRLIVSLDVKNWPEHGVLLLKTSQIIAANFAGEDVVEGENVNWYLLTETARAMGVSVEKVVSTSDVSLTIEFPRTVKRLEGLTSIEMDTGFDSLYSDSKPMAGHRLLVITNDEKLRMEIKVIARSVGLVVDFTPTTEQAVRFCEMDAPHMIIIDQRLRDHIFDELRGDLRRTEPNYPFIEIATESNTLEIAGWMSDSMTRLGHDALRSQLPSILMLELAKVM
jgi:CheY-like chemotaxis protein